jgi:hypothetical protein
VKLWEDRLWRLAFLGLTVVGVVGLEKLATATLAVAEAVPPPAPVFQAAPPQESGGCCPKCRCNEPPKLEVIEEPRR